MISGLIIFAIMLLFCPFSMAQSNMKITGDIMRIEGNIQIIEGHFRGEREGYVLTADRADMDEEKGILNASSRVVLLEEGYTLTCGTLIYFTDEERAVATDNPKVVEKVALGAARQSVLEAREIESFQGENRIIARGDVVLTQKNKANEEKKQIIPDEIAESKKDGKTGEKNKGDAKLYCDYLEMFPDEGYSVARGRIKITDGDMTAYGDRAIYYDWESRLILAGNAYAIQDTERGKNTVTGDKIIYFVDAERLIVTSAVAEVFPEDRGEKNK